MEKERIISEEKIVTLDFLNESEGTYCKKEDLKGKILQFAYITSAGTKLYIFDDMGNFTEYDWYQDEDNSHEKIINFLSEIAFRPLYIKGTPKEQKEAIEMWQICTRNTQIPNKFKEKLQINLKSK